MQVLVQLAEVTFSVELSAMEVAALRMVIDGFSNEAIAERLGKPIQVIEENFRSLKLENDLNLVEATRKNLITWRFHI